MKEKIFCIFILIFLGLNFVNASDSIITGEVITVIEYKCGGCLSDDNCYMIGARSENEYCSESKEMFIQKYPEDSCQEDYECFYNKCDLGKCDYPKHILVEEIKTEKNLIIKKIILREDFEPKIKIVSERIVLRENLKVKISEHNKKIFISEINLSKRGDEFLLRGFNDKYHNLLIGMINNSTGINNRFITEEKIKGKKVAFENNSFHFLNESSFFIDNFNRTQIIINSYSIDKGIVSIDFTLIDSIIPIPFNDGNYYFCEGYYIYEHCHTTGDSFEMQNKTYYVVNRTFETKKEIGSYCEFDYECEVESCIDKKCLLGLVADLPKEEVKIESYREESFLIKILNFLFGRWNCEGVWMFYFSLSIKRN